MIEVEREEEYNVEKDLNSQVYQRYLHYLIMWTGYKQPDNLDARNVNKLE